MSAFTEIHCPRCETLVLKIANGVAQGQCGKCKMLVTAGVDVDGQMHILVATEPTRRRDLMRVG